MGRPQHGVDGWDLVEQDWSPDTGVAVLTYERQLPDQPLETEIVHVDQPTSPKHSGWSIRN